ncbi:MAG: zf-HC2 domain-containing protein [Gemmatimonadaceae bacterium]|nr:zf-HC2 domain-containing protein [Gemmatimonadaceae bacterium]
MHETSPAVPPGIPVFDCEQTVRRLWDYLDGQLGSVDRRAVDAHLADCDRCPPHFEFERRFLETVRAARDLTLTPDAAQSQALREHVVAMLVTKGELQSPGNSR